VAKVFDVGVFDGHPFELIEYIPGGNLAELYGHSNSEEITEVVHQIADALHGLHSVRLVHGDLKPQNVLIRNRAPLDLALIDFGNETGTTVPYAAPERLAGQIGGPAVDWWGLGVIVHELAAGTEAGRESDAVAAVRILTEPVDLGDVADLRIRLLCEGLLARDPVLRWNHVRVREWLEGPPVADPLLPSRASRNPERRRQLRGRTVVPPAEQTDPRRVRPVVQGDAALVFESEVAAREFASNDSESPSWVNSGLDLRAK
jgi:serine/threonine protein kinase